VKICKKRISLKPTPPQTLILSLKIGVNEFYGALQTRNIKAYRTAQMAPMEEALQNSDSPNNLKLKIKLSVGLGSASPDKSTDTSKSDLAGGLSLQAIDKVEETE
jgi:hypothetical protein